MDTKRLENFEKMLAAVQEEYAHIVQQMDALSAQGKTKSATFRQLFAQKVTYQNLLSLYKTYDLIE